MFSMQVAADLVRRNQRLITITQYLAGASTLLVPSRSPHYEVYTEASYCLSQLLSFCNKIVLENDVIDGGLIASNSLSTGGDNANANTEANRLGTNGHSSKARGFDYYIWVMTRALTQMEVLLEKAAGAFWGENSRQRSLLILGIECLKAMERLFALLSVPSGKQIMILNWSKTYTTNEETLDLSHYKLWYKVQYDRIKSESALITPNRINRPKKNRGDDLLDLLGPGKDHNNSTTSRRPESEGAFKSSFTGRRSGLTLNYCSAESSLGSAEIGTRTPITINPSYMSSSSSKPTYVSNDASDLKRKCSTVTVVRVDVTSDCTEEESERVRGNASSEHSLDTPVTHSPSSPSPSSPTSSDSYASFSTPTSTSPPALSSSFLPASFPSSSSGMTDNESTTSTESERENNQNTPICNTTDCHDHSPYGCEKYDENTPANRNEESHKNSNHNENSKENENGNVPHVYGQYDCHPSIAEPLQNTIYSNYCSKYDITPPKKTSTHLSRECSAEKMRTFLGSDNAKLSRESRSNEVVATLPYVDVITSPHSTPSSTPAEKVIEERVKEIVTRKEEEERKDDDIDSERDSLRYRDSPSSLHVSVSRTYDEDGKEETSESDSSGHLPLSAPSDFNEGTSDRHKSTQTDRVLCPSKSKLPLSTECIAGIGTGVKQLGNWTLKVLPSVSTCPFTAEQALNVAELLYVLRPVVYAWAVHFVGERRRAMDRNMDSNFNLKLNLNDVIDMKKSSSSSGASQAPSPSSSSSSSSNIRNNTQTAASSSVRPSDSSSERTAGPDTVPVPPPNSNSASLPQQPHSSASAKGLYTAVEEFLPLLLSLVMEVSSIKLTAIALRMAQEGEELNCNEREREKEDSADHTQAHISTSTRPPNNKNNSSSSDRGDLAGTNSGVKLKLKLKRHKWDEELSRRKVLLLYYLVRGQSFNRATLPLLQAASEFLRYVPIMGSLPSYAINMLSYLNRSHFRSASSS